jgi:hypothetical protein
VSLSPSDRFTLLAFGIVVGGAALGFLWAYFTRCVVGRSDGIRPACGAWRTRARRMELGARAVDCSLLVGFFEFDCGSMTVRPGASLLRR